ncbi:facilitated trehalose transporter Tret1-like [Oratosquilla oratoria]|uniref:facilitated trehalose transporter Tret1-like n=1 Tax=Oratosquilla oratoria TaxID=337810 RepID=UPI003F75FC34
MLGLVLAIASWLMMGLAPSKTELFMGRAISGAAYAFIVTVSQPLVSELVSPKIRGFAASLPMFFSYLAALEMNVANIFLPCRRCLQVLEILISMVSSSLYTFSTTPMCVSLRFDGDDCGSGESPYWLVKKGREDAAVSVLKSIYSPDDIEVQFQKVKQCVTLKSKKPGVREQLRQMRHSSNYKPVMLMAFIYTCYGSNGNGIVTPYSTLLFTQAGMTLDPRLCTIILGVVRIAAVIIGSFVTDLCGRRPLYIGSSILRSFVLGTVPPVDPQIRR